MRSFLLSLVSGLFIQNLFAQGFYFHTIGQTGVCTVANPCTQNFSTYTEIDPGTFITPTSASIETGTSLAWTQVAYNYKDWGAGYWTGSITELLDVTETSTAVHGWVQVGGFGNNLSAIYNGTGCDSAAVEALHVVIYNDTTTNMKIYIMEYDNTIQYTSIGSTYNGIIGTTYYLKFERFPTGGALGGGQAQLSIYSDAARTTLAPGANSVQVLDLHTSVKNYRYSFGIRSVGCNSAGHGPWSGTVLNMKIGH